MLATSEKINKDMNIEESKIMIDPIIGFLVLKCKMTDGSFYIMTEALIGSWNGLSDDEYTYHPDNDEEIIGVLPAPQHSYRVLGLFPCDEKELPYPENGTFEFLGYEFEGAYSPDWKKELEKRIKMKEERKKTEEDIIKEMKK